MSAFDYDTLDVGIRGVVRWLHAHDFETTDSGDGISKKGTPGEACMHDIPNVLIVVEPSKLASECDRLRTLLGYEAVIVDSLGTDESEGVWIQGNYDPGDGHALIMLMGLSDAVMAAAEIPWEAGVDTNGTPEPEAA